MKRNKYCIIQMSYRYMDAGGEKYDDRFYRLG